MPMIMQCRPLAARPRSIAARIVRDRLVKPDEDRLADQEMPDIELDDFRQRRDRLGASRSRARGRHGLRGRALRASRAPSRMRSNSASPRPPSAIDQRIAPGAGMDLDHRRAERRRRLDLLGIGGDEQRHPDAGRAQLRDHRARADRAGPATSRPPSVVRSSRRSGTRQAACGRVLQRDRDHLRRSPPFRD